MSVLESAKAQLFTEARSHHLWNCLPVLTSQLQELYDLLKWGPTSGNVCPARFVFVTTEESKQKLTKALEPHNVDQVLKAPVTVIVAYDERFYDHAAELFPAYDTTGIYAGDHELSSVTAFRNGTLQGAYALIAARALGLDVCGMSGFSNLMVDNLFFSGMSWRSNFLFTLGHGDPSGLYPRGPRLEFDVACQIV